MDSLLNIFNRTITQVIKLKLGLDIYEYTIESRISNFRNFEAELDVHYPIKGTEVEFGSDIFSKWQNTQHNYRIVNYNKDLSSMDITDELAGEPFRHKEMTFVYMFTILEDFGNSILEIVNNSLYNQNIEEGKSWHSKINKYAKNSGKDLILAFAQTFNLQRSEIEEKFVTLFFELKEKRNSIAHELSYPDINNFRTDIKSIIVLICYIYHINKQIKTDTKFYPWYDYDEN